MAAIRAFLWKAVPRSRTARNFFTAGMVPGLRPPFFGIAALAFGLQAISSVMAMLIAVPIAIGTALFIGYYANRRSHPRRWASSSTCSQPMPSIIYGLWGLRVLMTHMDGITSGSTTISASSRCSRTTSGSTPKSIFIASVVLAIMIPPTISALSREVFLQVPRAHREASLALGRRAGR